MFHFLGQEQNDGGLKTQNQKQIVQSECSAELLRNVIWVTNITAGRFAGKLENRTST